MALWLALASFGALAALMLTTNPTQNIIYAAGFFGLLLVFLISFGYWFVGWQVGEVRSKNRYRIIAVSLILIILLMFRSAQSLNWVDGVILLLIGFGLAFYISRRS